MGCSKSSSKREVYSNTILTQETRNTCTPMVDSCQCMAKLVQYCKVKKKKRRRRRKRNTPNRQPNFIAKATGKRRKKPPKLVEGKKL